MQACCASPAAVKRLKAASAHMQHPLSRTPRTQLRRPSMQATALTHSRLLGLQRNVRPRAASRAQRKAVRPAVAAAEAEAATVEPEAVAPTPATAAAAEEAAAAPAPAAALAEAQPQQQRERRERRQRPRTERNPLGPARTMNFGDIEVGKEYEGVVVSIREFGAFVNIGAQADGLCHISQISAGFTRNVADVLTVGQAVKVTVKAVDAERNKFSVTMLAPGTEAPPRRERSERSYERDAGEGGERPQLKQQARAPKAQRERRERKAAPVKPGDKVTGKVASVAAFGVFVELGEGFTGLLHESEMVKGEGGAMPNEGSEVEVVVLSVNGEKVALSQRSAEEIEQEKALRSAGLKAEVEAPSGSNRLAAQLARAGITADSFQSAPVKKEAAPKKEAAAPAAAAVVEEKKEEEAKVEEQPAEEPQAAPEPEPEPAPAAAEAAAAPAEAPAAAEPAAAAKAAEPAAKAAEPAAKAAAGGAISAQLVKELREASGAGMMDCKKALAECGGDIEAAKDFLRKKGLASADKKAGRVAAEGAIWSYIHAGSRLGVLIEMNCETDFVARGEKFQELVNDMAMQIAACPEVTVVSATDVPAEVLEKEKAIEMEKEDIKSKPEAIREKIVQGRVDKIAKTMALLEQPYIKDTGKTVAEVIKESIAGIGENIQIRRFERFVLGEGIEVSKADLAADVEAQTKAMQEAAAKKEEKKEEAPKAEAEAAPKAAAVAVSPALVKQLREKSGAGMMDCKKALAECGGDIEAASEFLRKKGLASADKKSGRVAAEGAVGAYIHAGSRLGVLVEVNCETDFVARGEKFRELVNDMAMQIAACPDVRYVSAADVPAAVLEKEKAIEMEKEDLKSKPEAIREKIVQGRVDKIAKEMALLEQAYIKDTSKTVAEHIKEAIAGIGENIQVRRFGRYVLGEGIERKQMDFAAEVAAQTGGKL